MLAPTSTAACTATPKLRAVPAPILAPAPLLYLHLLWNGHAHLHLLLHVIPQPYCPGAHAGWWAGRQAASHPTPLLMLTPTPMHMPMHIQLLTMSAYEGTCDAYDGVSGHM